MVQYTETPARELERIVEDLTKYSIKYCDETQCATIYHHTTRLLELRQYMANVKYVKETV